MCSSKISNQWDVVECMFTIEFPQTEDKLSCYFAFFSIENYVPEVNDFLV